MISDYYDKTASIERLQTIPGTNKKAFTAHISGLSCHVQPSDDRIGSDIAGGFGKDFLMFSDDADIAEGDRVFIDSEEYRVVGTKSLSFNGHSHRETRIRIFKS